MYIHICILIHIHVYIYIRIHICILTNMYTYTYKCTYIHTHTHICICTYIYIYTYIYVCIHTYLSIYAHIHTINRYIMAKTIFFLEWLLLFLYKDFFFFVIYGVDERNSMHLCTHTLAVGGKLEGSWRDFGQGESPIST